MIADPITKTDYEVTSSSSAVGSLKNKGCNLDFTKDGDTVIKDNRETFTETRLGSVGDTDTAPKILVAEKEDVIVIKGKTP